MNIDYFQVSQLKIPELYDYIEQRKREFEIRNTSRFDLHKILKIFSSLGPEFLIFLFGVVSLILFNTTAFILGLTSTLVFIVFYYTLSNRIISFEIFLKNLHSNRVKVLRDRKVVLVPEDDVSIGDVVVVSKGEKVPFDLRVIESNTLVVDESKVFGENKSSGKSATTLPKKEFKIYELSNIIFANSVILKGNGKGIVINKKTQTPYKPYSIINYRFKIKAFSFNLLISSLLSLLVFYILKDIITTIVFFSSIFFLLSLMRLEIVNHYARYNLTRKLLQNGIFLPTITKIDELIDINRSVIAVDNFSFDIYHPIYYLPSTNKLLDANDLIYHSHALPEEILEIFVLFGQIYPKLKSVDMKIVFSSILNNLTSIGLSKDYISEYKILDVNLNNSFNSLSTIRMSVNKKSPDAVSQEEVVFGIISLSHYTSQFGGILGIKDKEGIVVIKKTSATGMSDFYPSVVITFRKYDFDIRDIEKFENFRFFLLTELNFNEISKFLNTLDVDPSRFPAIGFQEFLSSSDEQKSFFLEKFHIFHSIPRSKFQEFARMFYNESSVFIDSFVEVSQTDVGLMKIPYLGMFFRSTPILSSTKSILSPFILINYARKLPKIIAKSKVFNISITVFACLVLSLLHIYGLWIASILVPFVLVPMVNRTKNLAV
ncbi:MAG: hypothetical protein RMJ37_05920 [Spirochaetia bacterium]|nr:hypothetical protein [Spirochaetota bacterium]MCX8097299.1 hypothetical protein [Spirochaetota bacterium]MDW8112852.1 hypothetical protein [Spirochaetia bacterium]